VLAAVFIPIAFLPSTAGRLFREFGGVLAGAVIISSFVALSLVPALTAKLPIKTKNSGFFDRTLGAFGRFMLNAYMGILNKALRFSWLTVLISLLTAGGAVLLYDQIENQLLPSEDRGTIRVFARGPDGVGLNYMNRQAEKI